MTMTATLAHPLEGFFESLAPRKIRTWRQFAEEELILPNGPRAGLHFRCGFMPWTGLILDELERSEYRRFLATGPVQSGKTLIFFVIPVMYHLFEIGESVIVGVPNIDMAQGIYEERLLPAIRRSRYRDQLPQSGAGSRGGKFTAIRMKNGAWLRFMGAGGGDEQRSSHTARVVVVTEMDKMDRPGAASRETDPVTQFEARSRAYGSRARFYGECTMSVKEGRIYREVCEFGTDTRVAVCCPHCGGYVVPERENFGGWQEADTIMAAREGATYACDACGAAWDETDRQSAIASPVLVSKGQSVGADGTIDGEPPKTNTWGFRWNAMHNRLIEMADIAEAEWRTERSESREDVKSLMQFTWALPYSEELINLSGLSREGILGTITRSPRGVVPPEAKKVTVFIDLGLYRCWWAAWAWMPGRRGALVDYGALEVPQERQPNPQNILTTLRAFREDYLRHGWQQGEGVKLFDICAVDSGWQRDIAYTFIREGGPRYVASKGFGSAVGQDGWRLPRRGKDRFIGNEWLVTRQPKGVRLFNLNADYWKRAVHEGFAALPGTPGSLSLFHANPREHLAFSRQILAEQEEEEFVPGRGKRIYWNRIFKDNHWLDCTAGCVAAADYLGISPLGDAPAQKAPPAKSSGGKRHIRTTY